MQPGAHVLLRLRERQPRPRRRDAQYHSKNSVFDHRAIIGAVSPQRNTYSTALHTKFAASSVLPLPLYFATVGYGHSTRERVIVPAWSRRAAGKLTGALPSSTHETSASNCP